MTAIAPIQPSTLQLATSFLRKGGLVAMPTETVYGLACDASNPDAVARLYAAKGRPSFNPLIAHVASLEMAQAEAVFSKAALALARNFWPGPLTLVLPIASTGTVCELARSGLETIAIRMPAHPGARSLIAGFGRPVVAPSANRSGHISPTLAEHVKADLDGKVDLILDGGPCTQGIESTIVSFVGDRPTLLRAGAVETSALEAFLDGPLARAGENEGISAPGQLKSHYAPNARLRLNANAPEAGEAWLGFGPNGANGLNLSPAGNLTEAAANLFAMLRQLDAEADRIAVAHIPNEGLGEAINDRLARAAHRD
jgi:L-threonylcarbamoyladenylate synthase